LLAKNSPRRIRSVSATNYGGKLEINFWGVAGMQKTKKKKKEDVTISEHFRHTTEAIAARKIPKFLCAKASKAAENPDKVERKKPKLTTNLMWPQKGVKALERITLPPELNSTDQAGENPGEKKKKRKTEFARKRVRETGQARMERKGRR